MKLKQILIQSKREVFNQNIASHPSHLRGEGMDFSNLREYESSDSVKKIDHITSAKLQKPYVRVYKEEKELNIVVISLLGGSTYFGTQTLKKDFIAKIVALIGFSAIKQNDKFSSYIYTNTIKTHTHESKKATHISNAVKNILDFNPLLEKVDYDNLETTILKHIKKRSLIFVIGDFLSTYSFKKLNIIHEIIPIIVRDKLEENLLEFKNINLIDPQTNIQNSFNLNSQTIKEYKKMIEKNDSLLYKTFKKDRVKFIKIYTDENPIKKLSRLFMNRYL